MNQWAWRGIGMSERHGNDADLKGIDKVRADHVGAINAGDADAWVALFADDGVQMPPNAPANVGKAKVGLWSSGLLSNFQVQFDLAANEVRVLGNWAFESGDYAISLSPSGGGPSMQDSGKYITIYWKSTGNAWQIARDIWNSNNPVPGM
jgi:uncharacterized protein (TIGR02246 family)